MATTIRESELIRELTRWFIDRLDQDPLRFDDEPLSYDGNTPYDIRFYELQQQAAHYWQHHYSFQPTPGQLMKGFFGAEFERFRRQRLAKRPWWSKIQTWCRGSAASLSSTWDKVWPR